MHKKQKAIVTFGAINFTLLFMRVKATPFLIALLLVLAGGVFAPAYAQEEDENPQSQSDIFFEPDCDVIFEEITNLRDPRFNTGSAWDMLETGEGMDVFTDLIPLSDLGMIAGGRFGKDKTDALSHPLLIRYDERLKKVWEVRATGTQNKSILRVLPLKDQWLVFGEVQDKIKGQGVYIGLYDSAGKSISEHDFFEPGFALMARQIILSQDGAGVIAAVQKTDQKDPLRQYGQVMKIGFGGNILWKRSFQTGYSNVFTSISATLNGDYLVTGQLVVEGDKASALLVRMDERGTILWQQTYPRGLSASLSGARAFSDGTLLAYGRIRPLAGANDGLSAWIMKTDSTGKVLWQRYFTGEEYIYEAQDAIVYEDGRASVLIQGTSIQQGFRNHARLATFSSSGQILFLEDFSDGQGVKATRLISGLNAERIIVGAAQTSFGENQGPNDPAPAYTYDGWFLAVPALDVYTDPCRTPARQNPLLP